MSESVVYIPLKRDTSDMYYRYKMPKLVAKIEGSGNGIKTVIMNMAAIAKALNRPPTYPTKYFGIELGAQVTMNNNEFIVNGSHDPDKLQSLVYGFINKFVFCQNCKNPETNLTVTGKTITQSCIACGHSGVIPNIHKLTSFIISHPPTAACGSGTAASMTTHGGGKKEAKKNGKHKDKETNGKSGSKKSTDGGAETTTTMSSRKASQPAKEEDDDWGDDDEFGSDDLTEEAHRERMRALTDGFSSQITIKDGVERANEFFGLLNQKKPYLGDVCVQKEVFNEAVRLGLREKGCLVLCEVLFTDNILDEIQKHRLLLLRFCVECKKAQKYLLGGLEKLIGDVYKEKLFGKAMNILKLCYDEDILDEDVIFEWAGKPSKKYIQKDVSKQLREKIQPFIKWLKEAEVDSDDEDQCVTSKKTTTTMTTNGRKKSDDSEVVDEDEDEDDGLDIEYSHRVNGIRVENVQPVNGDQDNGVDDLNIDDI